MCGSIITAQSFFSWNYLSCCNGSRQADRRAVLLQPGSGLRRGPSSDTAKGEGMSTSPLIDGGAPRDAGGHVAQTDERLYNHDLAPVPLNKRTWTGYCIFAMWMSDVHSVGGYTFAASLFLLGISGWQVLIALTIGILIVYLLMNLVGKPSYA